MKSIVSRLSVGLWVAAVFFAGLSLQTAHADPAKTNDSSSQSEDPFVMAAIGDSIMAGFNAYRLGDNRNLSWAAGDDDRVKSHNLRIAEALDVPVIAHNESIAGSEMAEMPRQVRRALLHNPEYVVINVGANDVCGWSRIYRRQLRRFKSDLDEVLTELTEAESIRKILIAPIPDVRRLKEVARDRNNCQRIWDALNVCSRLLGSGVSEADEERFSTRWNAANAAIEEVVEDFADTGKVLYDRSMGDYQFDWEHVSNFDCFHPNMNGQQKFSDLSWERYSEEILDR